MNDNVTTVRDSGGLWIQFHDADQVHAEFLSHRHLDLLYGLIADEFELKVVEDRERRKAQALIDKQRERERQRANEPDSLASRIEDCFGRVPSNLPHDELLLSARAWHPESILQRAIDGGLEQGGFSREVWLEAAAVFRRRLQGKRAVGRPRKGS